MKNKLETIRSILVSASVISAFHRTHGEQFFIVDRALVQDLDSEISSLFNLGDVGVTPDNIDDLLNEILLFSL